MADAMARRAHLDTDAKRFIQSPRWLPSSLQSGAVLNLQLRRSALVNFLLTALGLVAVALPFVPPPVSLAADGTSLETNQGYLEAAPLGLDVRYAWTLPGGRGENIRICDVEYSWNLTHSDLVNATSNLFVYVQGV